jgi:CHASE2 domain-containing sensor protein
MKHTIEEDKILKVLESLQPPVSRLVNDLMELLIITLCNTKFYKELMREHPNSEIIIVRIDEDKIHVLVNNKIILYNTQVLHSKGKL